MKIGCVVLIAGMLFGSTPLLAAADAVKHSQVTATSKRSGDKLHFEFKVGVPEGLVLNKDGPWALKIVKADGLAFPKNRLGVADFQDGLPGFKTETMAKPGSAGKVEYEATVFVCTKEKTTCYRDVHKGSVDWK